jgi:hypothetical protein
VTEGGASGDVSGAVVIDNSAAFNDFLQSVIFGGMFSFDVRFDVGGGATFGVALINEAFDSYLGVNGNIAEIGLQPGAADAVWAAGGLAAVTAVPEPADWLLMATGLALLGLTLRRRCHFPKATAQKVGSDLRGKCLHSFR